MLLFPQCRRPLFCAAKKENFLFSPPSFFRRWRPPFPDERSSSLPIFFRQRPSSSFRRAETLLLFSNATRVNLLSSFFFGRAGRAAFCFFFGFLDPILSSFPFSASQPFDRLRTPPFLQEVDLFPSVIIATRFFFFFFFSVLVRIARFVIQELPCSSLLSPPSRFFRSGGGTIWQPLPI